MYVKIVRNACIKELEKEKIEYTMYGIDWLENNRWYSELKWSGGWSTGTVG